MNEFITSVFVRFDIRCVLNATPLTLGCKSRRLSVEEPKVSVFLSLGANAGLCLVCFVEETGALTANQ